MSARTCDVPTRIIGLIILGFIFLSLETNDIISMLIGSTLLLLWAVYRRSQPTTERDRALLNFGSILLSISIPVLLASG